MGQRHRQAENARDECGGKKIVLLTLKEEVEALRWLMQHGLSMEQIICGLHKIGRSSVSRKKGDAKNPE